AILLAKRQLEDILMFPLILLGRLIARMRPQKREYDTFFFFPFYHIGGAEKVHANIAKASGGKNSIIYFTKKSANALFLKEFEASGCIIKNISKYTDNKWLYFLNIIYRGILSGYINQQKGSTLVFNGQCNFGYKLSPWINKKIPQVELIHSLCSFSYIRIPFLPFITRTVMISKVRIAEHLELYKRYDIPKHFGTRIKFILNAIDLPSTPIIKEQPGNLVALYVGRSTAEKRVHLIAGMSAIINKQQSRVGFQFLGDVKSEIPEDLHAYCHFYGNQSDPDTIDAIYRTAHILLLVSDTEGFPMVIMEAMARGLAIVSTAVGEIPLHIINTQNGFLIADYQNTDGVVAECIAYIEQLDADRTLLQKMRADNIAYAFDHFGMPRFNAAYNELFTKLRSGQN
ncbi:MAG: glycosyltransferase family 4 protein, partial [Chitinophagaceae bacterium]